jgi:hypothetical protein
MAYPLPSGTQPYTLAETLYNWLMTILIVIVTYASGYLSGRGKRRKIPPKVEAFLRNKLCDLEG